MNEGKSQIKAGAVLSMLGLILNNLIPFFYTPVMLDILGQEQYGLMGIASSFMKYLGLLNFGIGSSVVRYLVKYRAAGDTENEQRTFGLFIKVYSVIGLLILSAGWILSCNLEFYSRSMADSEMQMLKTLVRLMTLNSALFLPLSPFSSVVTAHEKFIFSKVAGTIFNIGSPLLNLVLLFNGFDVVGLTAFGLVYSLLSNLLMVGYVLCRLHIRPKFAKAEKGILKEILNYSAFVFLAEIVNVLYWATDKLIIGWAYGSVMTAIYNVGANFNTYITSISSAISGVLMPRITSIAVTSDTPSKDFTDLFIKVGRLQFVILSFVLSAFIAFGRQFLTVWVGESYAPAYWVALLTMIPVTIPLIQNTGLNILYATNKHRFRSVSYAFIAVLNVILTFILVEPYGIIGAAAATCIAYIIGHVFLMNWYYHRKIGIDIPLFWKNIVRMSPVMIVCGTAAWFILDRVGISGWGEFFLYAVIYTVVYLGLAYAFMMNDYERTLLSSPIQKVLRKLKRG